MARENLNVQNRMLILVPIGHVDHGKLTLTAVLALL
jgi:translation elongation factor EF-Tu-like GTPase